MLPELNPEAVLVETTPQERLALITIALLIMTGATVRMIAASGAEGALQFSAEQADSLGDGQGTELRNLVAGELAEEDRRTLPLGEGERIDPNQASDVELDRLPGIGATTALRIVEYRDQHGRFANAQALLDVPGIGPALLGRISPHISLPDGVARVAAPVDLNRADAMSLDGLPGIGPALAQRIVEHRGAEGRFQSWDDLEKVPGIGPGLRRRLESAARLGP